jgi:hypothetical protein
MLESHDEQNDVEQAWLRILLGRYLGDGEPRWFGKTAKRLPAKGESIAALRMRSA